MNKRSLLHQILELVHLKTGLPKTAGPKCSHSISTIPFSFTVTVMPV